MLDVVRALDTVARLGGDEFALILEEPASAGDSMASAERLLHSVRQPYELIPAEGAVPLTVMVGASIGVAVFPDDAADAEALLRRADAAMYVGKRGGKNRCVRASES